MIKITNIFPKNKNELDLVKFIGLYQYISSKDIQYFFNDTYYPKRISRLIKNKILRRYKKYLVLAKNGYTYLNLINQETTPLSYQKKYTDRLKFISHLVAMYHKNKYISFTPSFKIKNKTVFTESSRKYIGVLNIFGTNYLTYHISNEHTQKYINSVIYDLQKETHYKNVILLVNNIKRLNLRDFSFGFNSVIICEDNDKTLENLQYIQQINWSKIITEFYNKDVHISEYNFCNYTNNKEKFITTFYYVDTEKINRIDNFLRNNPNKQADIICNEQIVKLLRSRNTNSKF